MPVIITSKYLLLNFVRTYYYILLIRGEEVQNFVTRLKLNLNLFKISISLNYSMVLRLTQSWSVKIRSSNIYPRNFTARIQIFRISTHIHRHKNRATKNFSRFSHSDLLYQKSHRDSLQLPVCVFEIEPVDSMRNRNAFLRAIPENDTEYLF